MVEGKRCEQRWLRLEVDLRERSRDDPIEGERESNYCLRKQRTLLSDLSTTCEREKSDQSSVGLSEV